MSWIDPAAMLGIAVVGLGLVLTPGPNMAFLVSRSIVQGRRAGWWALLGVAAGFLVYLVAATAGLTAAFTAVPEAYLALKIAGAGYLFYLAWQALRPGGTAIFAPSDLPEASVRKLVWMGFLTNLLNPKIAVLYVSLLPQFLDPDRGAIAAQSFALGATQIAVALTVNAVVVGVAGSLAALFARRPSLLRAQRAVMGSVLGLLAVKMLTSSRPATP